MRRNKLKVLLIGDSVKVNHLQARLPSHYDPIPCAGWTSLADAVPAYRPDLIVFDSENNYRFLSEQLDTATLGTPIVYLDEPHWTMNPEELDCSLQTLASSPSTIQPNKLNRFVGVSESALQVKYMIRKAATTDASVLILGENGTGKEIVAQLIHDLSKRSKGPWIPVNCASIPENLAESELFGSCKGAFTNAENRDGYCQRASSGTLFLDEIGELPLPQQAKFLRTLETGEVHRIGSKGVEKSNFRLLSATNKDLRTAIDQKEFRQDLYYRINPVVIRIPPLRDRRQDIPWLAMHILPEIGAQKGVALSQSALKKLETYDWPGNVRELRNVLQRATIFMDSLVIEPDNLDLSGD